MRKSIRIALALAVGGVGMAFAAKVPTGREWEDHTLLHQGKEVPHADFAAFPDVESAKGIRPETSPWRISLDSETAWRFRWSRRPEERPVGFEAPGFNVSAWDVVKVPCSWQAMGIRADGKAYDRPYYGNLFWPFCAKYPVCSNDWPRVRGLKLEKDSTWCADDNPVGSYRRDFDLPADWAGERVTLRFDGVDSFFYVWVNGTYLGFSKSSRDPAEFDVSSVVKPGKNTLAVEVYRFSDGSYLEDQDMFTLSGIFRPVSLLRATKTYIRDVVLATRPAKPRDYAGAWMLDIDVETAGGGERSLDVEVFGADGKAVPFAGAIGFHSELEFASPKLWSAEEPNLYTLVLTLKDGERVTEAVSFQLGFREVEIREAAKQIDRTFLLNGQPIKMRGANRHETSPKYGHFTPDELIELDVKQLKQANCNHVRNAHYPEPTYFYYLCNKYGIYVMDEANIESHGLYYGEHSISHAKSWFPAHVDRTLNMVKRNRNHPSILIWSLGNEAGPGDAFKASYYAAKNADLTRPVQYERNNWIGDMGARQYPTVDWMWACAKGEPVDICFTQGHEVPGRELRYPYHVNEYAHNMGNAMGNLKDYQDAIESTTRICGAAIWDWVDQGLYHVTEKGVKILAYGGDFGDRPTEGQFMMNGCVLSDRTVEPGYWEIKHVFQPFTATLAADGMGIELFNRHYFRSAAAYVCAWTLLDDGRVVGRGTWDVADLAPRAKRVMPLPKAVSRIRAKGRTASVRVEFRQRADEGFWPMDWVIADDQIDFSAAPKEVRLAGGAVAFESEDALVLKSAAVEITFLKKTGEIVSYKTGKGEKTERLLEPMTLDVFRAPSQNETREDTLVDWYAKGLHALAPEEVSFSSASMTPSGVTFRVAATYRGTKCEKLDNYLRPWLKHVPIGTAEPDKVVAFRAESDFRFGADGRLLVRSTFFQTGVAKVEPPRVGWRFVLKGAGQQVDWFGAGPFENYPDRKSGAFLGRWSLPAREFFFPYDRPQTCGNREDTRELAVGPLKVLAQEKPFAFGVCPYSEEELVETFHPAEMPESNKTCVGVYARVRGLGGNSCGPVPIARDIIRPTETNNLAFVLAPAP